MLEPLQPRCTFRDFSSFTFSSFAFLSLLLPSPPFNIYGSSSKRQRRGDPAVNDYSNRIAAKREAAVAASLEDLLRRKPNRVVLLTVLEGLSLAVSAAVALRALWPDTSGSRSVDSYYWSYLIGLYMLRLKLLVRLKHVRGAAWNHALSLYTFRWCLAVMVLRIERMRYSQGQASAEVALAFITSTSILLVIPLVSPRLLAKDPGAIPDPTRVILQHSGDFKLRPGGQPSSKRMAQRQTDD